MQKITLYAVRYLFFTHITGQKGLQCWLLAMLVDISLFCRKQVPHQTCLLTKRSKNQLCNVHPTSHCVWIVYHFQSSQKTCPFHVCLVCVLQTQKNKAIYVCVLLVSAKSHQVICQASEYHLHCTLLETTHGRRICLEEKMHAITFKRVKRPSVAEQVRIPLFQAGVPFFFKTLLSHIGSSS